MGYHTGTGDGAGGNLPCSTGNLGSGCVCGCCTLLLSYVGNNQQPLQTPQDPTSAQDEHSRDQKAALCTFADVHVVSRHSRVCSIYLLRCHHTTVPTSSRLT